MKQTFRHRVQFRLWTSSFNRCVNIRCMLKESEWEERVWRLKSERVSKRLTDSCSHLMWVCVCADSCNISRTLTFNTIIFCMEMTGNKELLARHRLTMRWLEVKVVLRWRFVLSVLYMVKQFSSNFFLFNSVHSLFYSKPPYGRTCDTRFKTLTTQKRMQGKEVMAVAVAVAWVRWKKFTMLGRCEYWIIGEMANNDDVNDDNNNNNAIQPNATDTFTTTLTIDIYCHKTDILWVERCLLYHFEYN